MAIHQYVELATDYSVYPAKVTSEWRDFAEGCVIYAGNRSVQIMSDVWGTEYYAVYWDEATKSIKQAPLDTYEWQRSKDKWGLAWAEVDATPAVWRKVQKFYEKRFLRELTAEAEKESRRIIKGSVVKVTSGRSWKGTQGEVIALIERPYKAGWNSHIETKLGIALSDEMVEVIVRGKAYQNHKDVAWVWQRNVEIQNPRPIQEKAIKENAKHHAEKLVEHIKKGGSPY
jgi:hypothetical protein